MRSITSDIESVASKSAFDVLGTVNAFLANADAGIRVPRSSTINAKYPEVVARPNPISFAMPKAMKNDAAPIVSAANRTSPMLLFE